MLYSCFKTSKLSKKTEIECVKLEITKLKIIFEQIRRWPGAKNRAILT